MPKKRVLASTVLATVQGPGKTLDLELPGDVPVSELLPLLLELCSSPGSPSQKELQSPFHLQVVRARAPLAPNRTLIEAEVGDGAVLILQTSTPPENLAPRPLVPRSVRPTTNAGGIGVTWESLE
ncbi:EsaB/YukD family protein [Ktedonobacter sp. SOSP1-85]|uniref:EsaB/YukD family protein n=1 Tax=Ktedonobacter sp. SOSP1-85 TaxID=2778367 RepID=UPI001915EAB9|nr:EsaB/YukD family protein [Ktedonobacter sp. SOSP1-85]